MTLIEFFDPNVNANIVSCLHLRPKKVVFLGDDPEMNATIERYKVFFAKRHMEIHLDPKPTQMRNIDQIADDLLRVVRKEAPCVIDVTGGDERLLIAVGILLERLSPELRKQVSIQKFDPETGLAQDCDGDGKTIQGKAAEITAKESVFLHYGKPSSSSDTLRDMYRAKDLDPLWEIACRSDVHWNDAVSAMIFLESKVNKDERKLGRITLTENTLSSLRSTHNSSLQKALDISEILLREGIIKGFVSEDCITYHYTSPLYRYCTEKAGNILEMKALLEAQDVLEKGKPYFNDCQMSVDIIWDDLNNPTATTNNEIDLILTRGLVSLFVSCKNGETNEEELYKMNSVATRFGGLGAKKMLIATDLRITDGKSMDKFIQRAESMGIHVVANAKELEKADWRAEFKEAFAKRSR